MSATVTHRDTCRLCNSPQVERVVDLDPIPLSEAYSTDRELARSAPRFPIDVYMCADCGHVQQLDIIDSENLWDSYTYYSGQAKGMPEHFQQMADKFITATNPPADALVFDIGSNDGSLLKPFQQKGFRVLGIDPATGVARRANEAGIETICDFMSVDIARKIRAEHGPADIICAFNVFAHADDLGAMVDSVGELLAPNGLFFFEAQYLMDIIDGVLIATIFHEHMSHHSVKPMVDFLDRHGLELIAAERSPIQHGSLIGTVQLKGGRRPVESSVQELLDLEKSRQLAELSTFQDFNDKVKDLRQKTAKLIVDWKSDGKTIAGYGAARSGPTLIAQMGLKGALDFIVDDHPEKVGKFETGDGIAVVPTEQLTQRMPDYTVILAWVHAQKIIDSNQEYLQKGGHFVVLCPSTRVVGKDGDVRI